MLGLAFGWNGGVKLLVSSFKLKNVILLLIDLNINLLDRIYYQFTIESQHGNNKCLATRNSAIRMLAIKWDVKEASGAKIDQDVHIKKDIERERRGVSNPCRRGRVTKGSCGSLTPWPRGNQHRVKSNKTIKQAARSMFREQGQ